MSVYTNIFVGGYIFESVQDALTAHAGGGQTNAFQLTAEINKISTVATAGDSVMLPPTPNSAQGGLSVIVINKGANPMQVFGQPGDKIDDLASATGVSQMQGSTVLYICTSPGNWYTEGLGTGYSGSLQTQSAVNSLTAFAGGGQASATALPASVNRVTTVATTGDSVKLPASAVGLIIVVSNAATNAMDVFPTTGDVINTLAANTALRISGGTTVTFWCSVAGTWHSSATPLPASKYTQNTTSGATTAAVGDLTGAGFVSAEYTAVGAATLTTRTATQMFNDTGNVQPGDSYMLMVLNSSGGTTTLAGGTGVTVTGTATMATNTARLFNVKFATATTVTITNMGGGIAK
jgi:hypothetical protein